MYYVGPILVILAIMGMHAFLEWYLRGTFIVVAYANKKGHKKSGRQATRHYKKNWSLLQRLLWVPVFKEGYGGDWKIMVLLSYVDFVSTLVWIVFIVINCWFAETPHFSDLCIYCCILRLVRLIQRDMTT